MKEYGSLFIMISVITQLSVLTGHLFFWFLAMCNVMEPLSFFLLWCYMSTETIWLIGDGEECVCVWGGGGSGTSQHSDPKRLKRPSATARTPKRLSATTRTTLLRRWGPRQYEATAISPAVQNKVTKTESEKQLLRNNSAARWSIEV